MAEPMPDKRLDEIERAYREAPQAEWLMVASNAVPGLITDIRQLREELAETRHVVAEWLYGANSGQGSDPGDLQYAFETDGRRSLAPEFDAIEAEEQADA